MVKYADRLLLYDNLDKPLSETLTPGVRAVISHLPKKMNFVIAILCVKGRLDIGCNMEKLSITDGGLMVLVPGTIAESVDMDMDSRMIVIVVPDDEYAPDSSFHNATYAKGNFTSPVAIQLDESTVKSGIETYLQLKSVLKEKGNKVNNDLVKAYMTLLAGLAAVNFQKILHERRKIRISASERIYKDFLVLLSYEYRMHKDVSFYADAARLSAKYFAKQIFNASGRHPLEIIRDQVILDAKSMLNSSDYSIKDICGILDFPSTAQFSRYFKAAVGMTPGEYRKSINQTHIVNSEDAL